ncbi:MAG: sigma-70 family RNA polymerase sigma factor [Ardenticatenaceae bacterium]|nr:sigma-70 family RNA polymerase sigma factor [Ardenticatenaceae bacterium]
MNQPPAAFTDSAAWYNACQHADPDAYSALFVYLSRVALQVVYDQPEAESLAQDCAQTALIRIHHRLDECREPAAFRTWARQIASHIAIDALRRRARLTFAAEDELDVALSGAALAQPLLEKQTAAAAHLQDLYAALQNAPISDRSRRVVVGRYLQELPDDVLATLESKLTGTAVLPSHIQVTRAKNIAKLRQWPPLVALLNEMGD